MTTRIKEERREVEAPKDVVYMYQATLLTVH
jgi:hypothetical protein